MYDLAFLIYIYINISSSLGTRDFVCTGIILGAGREN